MCSTSPLGSPGSTTAAVAVTAVALAATHFSMASVLPEAIAANTRDGDVVICMGAGSIGTVAGKTAELLKEKTAS